MGKQVRNSNFSYQKKNPQNVHFFQTEIIVNNFWIRHFIQTSHQKKKCWKNEDEGMKSNLIFQEIMKLKIKSNFKKSSIRIIAPCIAPSHHPSHSQQKSQSYLTGLYFILWTKPTTTLALFYWCDYYWWCVSINFAVNNNKTKTNTNFRFSQISSWFSSFSIFRRHFLIFHMEINRFGKCSSAYSYS